MVSLFVINFMTRILVHVDSTVNSSIPRKERQFLLLMATAAQCLVLTFKTVQVTRLQHPLITGAAKLPLLAIRGKSMNGISIYKLPGCPAKMTAIASRRSHNLEIARSVVTICPGQISTGNRNILLKCRDQFMLRQLTMSEDL